MLSLPLAFINALGTIVAVFYVDKLGRRYIMLRTLPWIGISMAMIGVGMGIHNFTSDEILGKWIALLSLLCYLAFFSVGMGGTPWTVNSEIYPLHLRGSANALSTTANWISNFLVSQVFLTSIQTKVSQTVSFGVLGLFSGFAWIFIYFLLPETKGKSVTEIIAELTKKPHIDINA
jgi:hypothetical protein